MMHSPDHTGNSAPPSERLWAVSWPLVILVSAVAGIGTAMLYSVAGGSFDPWAARHATRFIAGLGLIFFISSLPVRFWLGIAYPVYLAILVLLVAVAVAGTEISGANRWLRLGGVTFQPSEFVKVGIVLALARYYQWVPRNRFFHPAYVIAPLLIVIVPVAMILKQPDLGTAGLVASAGFVIMFLAGTGWWYVAGAILAAGVATPYVWSALHGYQKERVLNFLEPERDPLGLGYQIFQSKIALGSGGVSGKGFMRGTQSQLDFLPEKHTDFMFTIIGEELGFVGTLSLLALYSLILILLFYMCLRCRAHFTRLLIAGTGVTLFLHLFVNAGMVMGLLPVVGAPLPLISYGGTSLFATMCLLGLAMNAFVHRRERIDPESVNPLV
ncbi:MAG: rod shape-determining protein RodA [Hyphomicrobiaceae bacterium]